MKKITDGFVFEEERMMMMMVVFLAGNDWLMCLVDVLGRSFGGRD